MLLLLVRFILARVILKHSVAVENVRLPQRHFHKEFVLSVVSCEFGDIFVRLASFAFVDVTCWPCIVVGSIDLVMAIINLCRALGCLKSETAKGSVLA